MNAGAGVAASVLEIPAAAYAVLLASSFYGCCMLRRLAINATCGCKRNRPPPEANGLLAAALINPAPPTLRQPGGA